MARRRVSYGISQVSSLGPLLSLVFIDDLPKRSTFEAIFFTDDIYLMLSNKSLMSIGKNVNNELGKIDHWLRLNNLTMDYLKTNHISINKVPKCAIDADFEVAIHQKCCQSSRGHKIL